MTDTSAIDQGDDESTKTTPDQPGQPRTWQPPPGAPSPLGSLVQKFSQMFPRPVGPLPQQQPQFQPPLDKAQQAAFLRLAPYDRPTGPLPPYRQAPVQTYVPAQPIRPPNEWGTPGEYPNTPQTWELGGMWSGIGQKLSQNGSGNVSPIARLLMGLASSGTQSYVAGQDAQIKLRHARAVEAATELDRLQEEELKNARDSYAVFGGANWTGENTDENLPHIGKWWDAQRAIAARGNDTMLQAAIDTGDPRRVDALWKERDAASKDLKATLAQQQKDDAERRALSPYLEDGGRTQAGPMRGEGNTPSPEPIDKSVPPDTGEPGEPQKPAQPTSNFGIDPSGEGTDSAPPGSEAAPTADGGPVAQAQPQRPIRLAQAGASDAPLPGLQPSTSQPDPSMGWRPTPSQALQQAGQDNATRFGRAKPGPINDWADQSINDPMFKASGKASPIPQELQGYVGARTQEKEADLRRIEQDPRFSPQQGDTPAIRRQKARAAYNAMRQVDPELADTVWNSVAGKLPMPTSARYQNLRQHIVALGSKIDPSFGASSWVARNKAMIDFTSGLEARTLTKIGVSAQHTNHAIDALDHVPPYILQYWAEHRWLGGGLAPKWIHDEMGTLDQSINTAISEYEAAILGGKPTQAGREERELRTNWRSMPAEQIKAYLRDMQYDLKERMNGLKTQWAGAMSRQPEGMLRTFEAFTNSGQAKGWPEDATDFEIGAPTQEDVNALKGLDQLPPRNQPATSNAPSNFKWQ